MSGDSSNPGQISLDYLWQGEVVQSLETQGYFYMHLGTNATMNQFRSMEADLVDYCETSFSPASSLAELTSGQLIVGKVAGGSSQWKRGVITEINNSAETVTVLCIDYGNIETLSAHKLCCTFPPQFEAHPYQAVRCKLAGVKPIGKTWTSRGIKLFQSLSKGQPMKVLVMPSTEPDTCFVALYPRSEQNGRSVAHGLLDEDVAMPMDDQDIPEFVNDVPSFIEALKSASLKKSAVNSSVTTPDLEAKSDSSNTSRSTGASGQGKYIPPHQKTMNQSPGLSSPAFDKFATPPSNNSYGSPKGGNRSFGAPPGSNSFATPPGNSSYDSSNYTTPTEGNSSKYSTPQGYNLNNSSYSSSPAYNSSSANQKSKSQRYGPPPGYVNHQSPPPGFNQSSFPPRYRQQQAASPSSRPPSNGKPNYYQQNNARSPTKNVPSPNSDFKVKEPVNDFFPFGKVFPASPGSPSKSPEKDVDSNDHGYGDSSQGSYFSRSSQVSRPDENFGSSHRNGTSSGPYSRALDNDHYSPSQRIPGNRSQGRNRFGAKFENLPNTFEPTFLNQPTNEAEDKSYQGEDYKTSPSKSSGYDASGTPPRENAGRPRPKLNIPSHPNNPAMPFYPPNRPAFQNIGNPGQTNDLLPPGFYQGYEPSDPPKRPYSQQSGSFPRASPNIYPNSHQHYPGINNGNGTRYRNGPNASSRAPQSPEKHTPVSQSPHQHSTSKPIAPTYHQSADSEHYDHNKQKMSQYSNQNSNNVNAPPLRMPTKYQPPTRYPVGGNESGYKFSPESPESPAILDFDFSHLEHTHGLSEDHLMERSKKERLAALQEEQEVIARETEEQAELVNMARFGSRSSGSYDKSPSRYERPPSSYDQSPRKYERPTAGSLDERGSGGSYDDDEDDRESGSWPDIVDEITRDIRYSNEMRPQEYEDLRTTPIKRTSRRSGGSLSEPVITEADYRPDIDFAEAVKQTLEYAREDGHLDNTKALLAGIIESLKGADVEKQLYDVLLLMLAYAIKEYDQFHVLLMDSINTISGEMDVRECLLKALKRQQDLSIRVGHSKHQVHQTYARVMGHVYNLALSWHDCGSSIQDFIIATVEKWILFNSKGQQIGQQEKESVFLDCFTAFWEISGHQLCSQVPSFTARVHGDLNRKILNDNVSRCIRERLLLEVHPFLYPVQTSENQQSVATQTERKTMIPSSCQVKPSLHNTGTWTGEDWEEDFPSLDAGNRLPSPGPIDYTTPDPAVSLRPLGMAPVGRGGSLNMVPVHGLSTPSGAAMGLPTGAVGSKEIMSLSQLAQQPSQSVSLEPAGSRLSDRPVGRGRTLSGSALDGKGLDRSSASPVTEGQSSLVNSCNTSITSPAASQYSGAVKSNTNEVKSSQSDILSVNAEMQKPGAQLSKSESSVGREKSVSETKSASGKSIVDWFDYEPPQAEIDAMKLEEKKLKAKKRLDSASMTIIESEIEAKAKSDLMSKSKRDRRKAKAEDSASKNDFLLENFSPAKNADKSDNSVDKKGGKSVPGIDGASLNSKSDKSEAQPNSYRSSSSNGASGTGLGNSVVDDNSRESDENEENWDTGFPRTNEVHTTSGGAVNRSGSRSSSKPRQRVDEHLQQTLEQSSSSRQSVKPAHTNQGNENETIDWWGEGEPANVRLLPGVTETCDIYTDLDPDVIIEDEFIEEVTELVEACDLSAGKAAQNPVKADAEKTKKQTSKKFPPELDAYIDHTDDEKSDNEAAVVYQPDLEEKNTAQTVGDKDNLFSFDDEDDETWDDRDDFDDGGFAFSGPENDRFCDEHEDFEAVSDTHKTNVSEFPANVINIQRNASPMDSTGTESDYERNFPRSNLGDFIRPSDSDSGQSTPSSGRWVPGQRKCLNCHEVGHTTDSCTKKFMLF